MKRSSPCLHDRTIDEEIFGGNYVQQEELPRRKRKAIAKRSKPRVDGIGVQNDMAQAQCPHVVVKENENLRLQLALKTNELKLEENRRLKLELILKMKEIKSLQKQNEELKAENEILKKTAKPRRVERLCRFCQKRVLHDYGNCPERLRAARFSEEEEGEDSA